MIPRIYVYTPLPRREGSVSCRRDLRKEPKGESAAGLRSPAPTNAD